MNSPARRRHSAEFKHKVCSEIRSGFVGRREAQRLYELSDNLLQTWLARFDSQARVVATAAKAAPAQVPRNAFEKKIAVLERKVGQLTMALEERSPPGRKR